MDDQERLRQKLSRLPTAHSKLTSTSVRVSPNQLAEALGISNNIIRVLVELGYLRVYSPHGGRVPEVRKILCDPTGLIHWPYITLTRVCRSLRYRLGVEELLKMCRDNNIKVHQDECRGYVVHVDGLRKLLFNIQYTRYRRPVDRVWMTMWLAGIDPISSSDMPKFNEIAEKELMRIAKLKDPMRTEQALRFALRYRDAEVVAGAILKARTGDLDAVLRKKEAARLKGIALRLASLEARAKKSARAPAPAPAPRPRSSLVPSFAKARRGERVESSRILRQSQARPETPDPSLTVRP